MIYVYGASDDLVEIEGDIREEFYPAEHDAEGNGYYLGFSNGTIIKVRYVDEWVLRVIRNENGYDLYPAGTKKAQELSGNDYSDVIELDETITWVVGGSDMRVI